MAVSPSDREYSLLDNPMLNALLTEHSHLALIHGSVRRYPPAIGPLSGIPDQSLVHYDALRQLAGPGGTVALFLEQPPAPPAGWTLLRNGLLGQMICLGDTSASVSEPAQGELRRLTAEDVPAMVELAQLTEPGPFRERTHELGVFFGIFDGKRLLAMAGQRLSLPRFVEVSAVCTHPDARGRGYAKLLIAKVNEDIRSQGKIPILHTFADNWAAIRVYESLGFTMRRHFQLGILKCAN